jgi:hypothetical protein
MINHRDYVMTNRLVIGKSYFYEKVINLKAVLVSIKYSIDKYSFVSVDISQITEVRIGWNTDRFHRIANHTNYQLVAPVR